MATRVKPYSYRINLQNLQAAEGTPMDAEAKRAQRALTLAHVGDLAEADLSARDFEGRMNLAELGRRLSVEEKGKVRGFRSEESAKDRALRQRLQDMRLAELNRQLEEEDMLFRADLENLERESNVANVIELANIGLAGVGGMANIKETERVQARENQALAIQERTLRVKEGIMAKLTEIMNETKSFYEGAYRPKTRRRSFAQ